MNKIQVQQWKMMLKVDKTLNEFNSVWNAQPFMVSLKDEFSTRTKSITTYASKQSVSKKGIATQKKKHRVQCENLAFKVSIGLASFATVTDNTELYKKAYYTPTKLKVAKGEALLGICHQLHQLATNQLANLAPFGVNANVLNQFMQAIETFTPSEKSTTEALVTQKEATKKLHQAVKENMDLLYRKMDVIIRAYGSDFYKRYRMARAINNMPTRRRVLTITCMNAINKLPIHGVSIQIGNLKKKLVSGKKGKNYIQHLKSGSYTVTFSHPQFATKTEQITVQEKKHSTLVVQL